MNGYQRVDTSDLESLSIHKRMQPIFNAGFDILTTLCLFVLWVCICISLFLANPDEHSLNNKNSNNTSSTSIYTTLVFLLTEQLHGQNTTCFDGGMQDNRTVMLTGALLNVMIYLIKICFFFQLVCSSLKEYAALNTRDHIILKDDDDDGFVDLDNAQAVSFTMVKLLLVPMAFAHLFGGVLLTQTKPYLMAYSTVVSRDYRVYCVRLYLLYIVTFCQAVLNMFAGLLALVRNCVGTGYKRTQVSKRMAVRDLTRILNEITAPVGVTHEE